MRPAGWPCTVSVACGAGSTRRWAWSTGRRCCSSTSRPPRGPESRSAMGWRSAGSPRPRADHPAHHRLPGGSGTTGQPPAVIGDRGRRWSRARPTNSRANCTATPCTSNWPMTRPASRARRAGARPRRPRGADRGDEPVRPPRRKRRNRPARRARRAGGCRGHRPGRAPSPADRSMTCTGGYSAAGSPKPTSPPPRLPPLEEHDESADNPPAGERRRRRAERRKRRPRRRCGVPAPRTSLPPRRFARLRHDHAKRPRGRQCAEHRRAHHLDDRAATPGDRPPARLPDHHADRSR